MVVSDMRMPDMNGVDFLSRVRERWPGVARVALSGQTELDVAIRSLGLVHRFLTKPWPHDGLLATLTGIRDSLLELGAASRDHVVSLRTLPSDPAACRALDDALARPDASIERVADVIASDVALSAKTLQLVSSSFFGTALGPVGTARDAVHVLGVALLRDIAPHAFDCTAWNADLSTPPPEGSDSPIVVGHLVSKCTQNTSSTPASLGSALLGLWGVPLSAAP